MLWLVVGVSWSSGQISTPIDVRTNTTSRLGFRFDQQAHDAAVAEKSRSDKAWSLAAEPPDPDVVRLPKYIVSDERIGLEEREVLTPKGKVELAKKRYLTPMYQKTFGPLMGPLTILANPLGGWSVNAPEAMAIYEDFEAKGRKTRMSELTELGQLAEKAKNPAKTPRKKKKRER
jgi:hypothetical protein